MWSRGPDPRACVETLMDCRIVIRGNHEDAVLFYGEDFNPKAREALEWTKDQLNSPEYDRTQNYELWNFLGSMEEIAARFRGALIKAQPKADVGEMWWGMAFCLGAMIHTWSKGLDMERLSGGEARYESDDRVIDRLVRFGASGLRELAAGNAEVES